MSDEQGRRVGLNESIFRQVNEQIESLNHGFGQDLRTLTVICECANGDCTERIEITVSAYEKVRANPLRYIVIPGHELPEFESVVGCEAGYDIVEKREGAAAKLAEETDPRS
ncbi:MAG TPA: hypothetical protein VKO84_10430 [Gaiellaceae bacterium]|nr:hypothetical protein [Gaiellaceae bacterium]